jgi:hypothetical protein
MKSSDVLSYWDNKCAAPPGNNYLPGNKGPNEIPNEILHLQMEGLFMGLVGYTKYGLVFPFEIGRQGMNDGRGM